MNQFRIVADSSCDLLTLGGADFVSVPLTIRTDAEEFYDDANLDVDAMVSTLRDTKGRSYSACPNIADWESAFGESGDVIAFTITSALSGSYNAACVAKKNCEERNPTRRIYVVDSLSAGPEIALLIERAVFARHPVIKLGNDGQHFHFQQDGIGPTPFELHGQMPLVILPYCHPFAAETVAFQVGVEPTGNRSKNALMAALFCSSGF